MKKLSSANKGFISVYFLSMLLYCMSIVSIVMINDQRRAKTAMNIQIAKDCFIVESAVINDIRCMIEQNELEAGFYTAHGITYSLQATGTTIYCTINSELVQSLEITFDPVTRALIDYESSRIVAVE